MQTRDVTDFFDIGLSFKKEFYKNTVRDHDGGTGLVWAWITNKNDFVPNGVGRPDGSAIPNANYRARLALQYGILNNNNNNRKQKKISI